MTTNKYKGVVEIEICGEKVGFKFGMACMAMLCKLENATLQQVQERLGSSDLNTSLNFYYSAAVQYAKLYKTKEPSFEEVANYVDNMSTDQMTEAVKVAFGQYVDPNEKAPEATAGQS